MVGAGAVAGAVGGPVVAGVFCEVGVCGSGVEVVEFEGVVVDGAGGGVLPGEGVVDGLAAEPAGPVGLGAGLAEAGAVCFVAAGADSVVCSHGVSLLLCALTCAVSRRCGPLARR